MKKSRKPKVPYQLTYRKLIHSPTPVQKSLLISPATSPCISQCQKSICCSWFILAPLPALLEKVVPTHHGTPVSVCPATPLKSQQCHTLQLCKDTQFLFVFCAPCSLRQTSSACCSPRGSIRTCPIMSIIVLYMSTFQIRRILTLI